MYNINIEEESNLVSCCWLEKIKEKWNGLVKKKIRNESSDKVRINHTQTFCEIEILNRLSFFFIICYIWTHTHIYIKNMGKIESLERPLKQNSPFD